MKVLTAVFAVGLLILCAYGILLQRRSGQFPKWYTISILLGSLALGASVVAFQLTQ